MVLINQHSQTNIILMILSLTFTASSSIRYTHEVDRDILNNNDARIMSSSCCILPTCHQPNRCYQTITCGRLCAGHSSPYFKPTTWYKKRENYEKLECRYNQCNVRKVDCNYCPNPQSSTFNIDTVRSDCKSCYHQ